VSFNSFKRLKVKYKFRNTDRDWIFIFDVDGVLTDGKFTYTKEGKFSKTFGSHDADALNFLSEYSQISFISADAKGFEVTSKRINDMGFDLNLVDSISRGEFLKKLQHNSRVVFTADSFTDSLGLKIADVSFAPKNAHPLAKKNATMILNSKGGSGAVAEVCLLYLGAIGRKF
jgi:3-deoxy-D-manno-octulosonate 8-phosphate phosphatase (KDO 8-P phosphatase)